jgi:colanic acid/amylovoran biosynthesis glycosyltransferase
VEKKGLPFALEAVKQAHDRFPQLEFRIIGDGELRPQIEHMIDYYQMRSYTTLLGFQSHSAMIAEMNAADILLQPSITAQNGDIEGGAPTTILEAQACGLPVIATTHADIPHVVISGESALLAPEGDSETLYKHIMLLLQEPERLAHMGKAGRAFVEHYHNIENEVQVLEDRYYALSNHQ